MANQDCQQLKKELNKIVITCCYCYKSEELTRCDILQDTTQCHKNICVRCFKAYQNENCDKCMMRLKDHYKKNKNPFREKQESQSRKAFYIEKKIRSNQMWEHFNPLLLDLLIYFNSHTHSERRKYQEYEKEIERMYQAKKKNKNTVLGEANKRYDSAYIKKVINSEIKQYPVYNYSKGITLIQRAFQF